MDTIMMIVSIVVGVLLLLGFLFGFLRNWKKSTIRASMILVCFICALIFAPKISNLLMDKFVNGLVISAFGFTIDIGEVAGDSFGDLLTPDSAITNVAMALVKVIINLVAFFILFIALLLVTLIIYWIISIIMSAKAKKKNVGKVKAKGWQRLIGGGVGLVASLVLCLGFFTPIFGLMGVCDEFIEESTTQTAASAVNTNSFVCGNLYYKEDDKIGTVEEYLEKYAEIKEMYDNSFAGKVLKFTGVNALGKTSFKALTTAEHNGVKINLTEECVVVVKVYNGYKNAFVVKKFDIKEAGSLDDLKAIYNEAKQSSILQTVLTDIVPKMASKWSNGEEFLGMELPLPEDYADFGKDILKKFDTDSFAQLDKNINDLFDVAKEIVPLMDVIEDAGDTDKMLDHLDAIGKILDVARGSEMLSKPVHDFMEDMLDKFGESLGDAVVSTIKTSMNDEGENNNWNNANYKYETLFNTLQSTAKVATSEEGFTLDGMKDTLKLLDVSDPAVKETVKDVLNNTLTQFVGEENDTVKAFSGIITSFIDNTTPATEGGIEKDIAAGEKIMELFNNDSQDNLFADDTAASSLVNTLTESKAIMTVLDSTAQGANTEAIEAIQDMVELSESDKITLSGVIDGLSGDKVAYKDRLRDLFGLN